MIDLYDLTEEDIIKYLDSSKHYKAIHKDRPYILGSILRGVYQEQSIYYLD